MMARNFLCTSYFEYVITMKLCVDIHSGWACNIIMKTKNENKIRLVKKDKINNITQTSW